MAKKGRHNGREGADDQLALLLAQGSTIRDAAATVGVSERTASRRWAAADFRCRVGEIRGEMVSQAVGKLAGNMAAAADRLRELLRSQNDTVALGACKAMLELPVKLMESTEVLDKVRALEDLLAADKQRDAEQVTGPAEVEDGE